ncbi:hypothetical protein ABFX02_01G102600 [Erythranthe guttata]
MNSLSNSSFIQRYAACIPSTPLLVSQSNIPSSRNNKRYNRISHQTPNPIRASSLHPKKLKPNETKGRTKNPTLLTNIFNWLDQFICDFVDPPLRVSIDPKHVLAGNFAPVGELPPTACTVVHGSLPPCLNGAYIRNGPNPQFFPRGPYHLFDGDGMLHSIKISDGEAIFCSRFVKTYKYNLEREIGSPVILNVFSAFNGLLPSLARCTVEAGRILAGEFDPRRGIGVANTSLALFAGKLFAMGESDLPYTVKLTSDGDIITLGRHESFGEPFMTMTAHPKVEAETGEAFAFRHSIVHPFLTYFRINADGIKQPEVPISSLKEASLIHDFAVTKNYAVFFDSQIVIKPVEILRGKQPIGVNAAKMPRLGIIRRYAVDENEMWWVDAPGFNMIHAVNAWEEDDGNTIVMVALNILGVEHVLERVDLIHSSVERIEIDVQTESIRRRSSVCSRNLEFAVINPAYVGKKNRYAYASIGEPMPNLVGVVKIDLSVSATTGYSSSDDECEVASHLYPPGCSGGEIVFVPREPENPATEEDDGYLVSYLYDKNTQESNFIVMDAKSPTLAIVAAVKLPHRVPFGFHGIFVPDSQLKKL